MPTLSDKAAQALKACVATRGPGKGMLLAKCPKADTLAAAAWQGVMLSVNPYKASITAQILFTEEQRAIANELTDCFDALPHSARIAIQRDRNALERLGVW